LIVSLLLKEHPVEIVKRQREGVRGSVPREGTVHDGLFAGPRVGEDHVTVCGSQIHFVPRSAVEGLLRVERRCTDEILVAREQERALSEYHGEHRRIGKKSSIFSTTGKYRYDNQISIEV
jgi:hypothetical protein